MAISDWPRAERPRERLIEFGPQGLSDAELLAVLIGSGSRGESALDIARRLLAVFGTLSALFGAPAAALGQQRGVGPRFYAQLQAALELTRRSLADRLRERPAFGSPTETRSFLRLKLGDREREIFAALFLDARHQLIEYEELFFGTVDGAGVYPREVVKGALACNAAAVIVAHNHPSGCCEPSRADQAITRRLRDALGLVDIRLLDHVIVGKGSAISLAEHGLL
jgi:DNA repair protein RadC